MTLEERGKMFIFGTGMFLFGLYDLSNVFRILPDPHSFILVFIFQTLWAALGLILFTLFPMAIGFVLITGAIINPDTSENLNAKEREAQDE